MDALGGDDRCVGVGVESGSGKAEVRGWMAAPTEGVRVRGRRRQGCDAAGSGLLSAVKRGLSNDHQTKRVHAGGSGC